METQNTWIMHTLAFDDDDRIDDLQQCIQDHGGRIIEVKGAFGYYDTLELGQLAARHGYSESRLGPIIAYGSCNFMKFVTSNTSWIPGHWCDWKKLECTSYMGKLAPYSIHHNYAYITFGELKHKWMEIYGAFSERHMVFIRPNSNAKPFHGQCVHEFNFLEWYREHEESWKIAPDTLCMVSQPSNIDAEWRLFVHRGKVISGSCYRPEWSADIPPFVIERAEKAIADADFAPFPIFSVDLALTKEGLYYIIEYGSINCAGLYAAPLEPIVEAANKEAQLEWDDYYGEIT